MSPLEKIFDGFHIKAMRNNEEIRRLLTQVQIEAKHMIDDIDAGRGSSPSDFSRLAERLRKCEQLKLEANTMLETSWAIQEGWENE